MDGQDGRPARALVIVAHPDDETLWAGGLILDHPDWDWFIAALCRANDPDRAPRFARAVARLRASGRMGDLDDGPEQAPLPDAEVQDIVLSLLPNRPFDLVLTHGPAGEYTRHRRHEETCRVVAALWRAGRIATEELWMFAYEDGGRAYLPRPRENAHRTDRLSAETWRAKHAIVTDVYGFQADSWEARCTPRTEAFWCFGTPASAVQWTHDEGREP